MFYKPVCFDITLHYSPRKAIHTHEFHEIFYCTGGRGWQLSEWGDLDTAKGDLFLFPAGEAHACSGDGNGCEAIVLNFDFANIPVELEGSVELRKTLELLCENMRDGNYRLNLSRQGKAKAGRIMQDLLAEVKHRRPGYFSALSIGVQSLLLTFLRDPECGAALQREIQPPANHTRIVEVIRLIESRYDEPLTVEDMARYACMSRSHFHSVFKQETGHTLIEYLNQVRVREATEMLRETDLPILEISQQAGFQTLSHFYHIFRQSTGKTPREVRLEKSPR